MRPFSLLLLFAIFIECALAKEVPPGLRPAKAVDEPEKPIVPRLEEEEGQQEGEPRKAKELTRTEEKKGLDKNGGEQGGVGGESRNTGTGKREEEANEEPKNTASGGGGQEKPLNVFQKGGKGKRRLSPAIAGSGTQVVQQVIKPNPEEGAADGTSPKPIVRTVPPPAGKDYGVNTLLQTNLVDSKGRVLKGVSSVPIPVPDIRNAKASRASSSRVDTEEAEKAVQINFSG